MHGRIPFYLFYLAYEYFQLLYLSRIIPYSRDGGGRDGGLRRFVVRAADGVIQTGTTPDSGVVVADDAPRRGLIWQHVRLRAGAGNESKYYAKLTTLT